MVASAAILPPKAVPLSLILGSSGQLIASLSIVELIKTDFHVIQHRYVVFYPRYQFWCKQGFRCCRVHIEGHHSSEIQLNMKEIIPIKLSKPVMSMMDGSVRQGEVTSHSRSYGEELQRRNTLQAVSAIGS